MWVKFTGRWGEWDQHGAMSRLVIYYDCCSNMALNPWETALAVLFPGKLSRTPSRPMWEAVHLLYPLYKCSR